MMILKTLALFLLFFVDMLSLIKDESCVSCFVVFCEDYSIQILLFGSVLNNIGFENTRERYLINLCGEWAASVIVLTKL